MGNVSYRFLLCFFDFFLMEIIFINYLIWSGAFVDIVGGTTQDLSNSYFGFQSVKSMIDSFGLIINAQPYFSIARFRYYLNQLVNHVMLGIPQLAIELGEYINGLGNFADLLKAIAVVFGMVFVRPVLVVLYLFMCLGCVLYYAFCLISVFFMAMAGLYNVPFHVPLPPMPINQVVDNVRITVPVLI